LAFQAVCDTLDDEPGSGQAVAVAAQALIRLREYRVARLALERALRLEPNQFEAAVALAELNLDLGNGMRGVEVLEMAARLRPRELRVWLTLGKVSADIGDTLRTIQAYQKVLELKPDHREALFRLIDALLSTGQSERATPWVIQAQEKYPDDPIVLGFAAHAAFDANRLDESIALADRALAGDPENPHALLARVRCRIARSEWREALPDAERATAGSPNDVGALHLVATIQTRLGMSQRAAETLVRLNKAQQRLKLMNELAEKISQNPGDPQLPWKMGQTACEAGSFLLASRCFEAALALDANFQPACESLAALRASHPEVNEPTGHSPSAPGAAGESLRSSTSSGELGSDSAKIPGEHARGSPGKHLDFIH
jgi:tetratricopeptide (TPR) repeat protein